MAKSPASAAGRSQTGLHTRHAYSSCVYCWVFRDLARILTLSVEHTLQDEDRWSLRAPTHGYIIAEEDNTSTAGFAVRKYRCSLGSHSLPKDFSVFQAPRGGT